MNSGLNNIYQTNSNIWESSTYTCLFNVSNTNLTKLSISFFTTLYLGQLGFNWSAYLPIR